MMVGRGMSPRQSNFGPSDAYSLQSSRGRMPRPSNFDDENTRDFKSGINNNLVGPANDMMNSPRFRPPLYPPGHMHPYAHRPQQQQPQPGLEPASNAANNVVGYPAPNPDVLSTNSSSSSSSSSSALPGGIVDLVKSLNKQRLYREITLALRTTLRDATVEFSFLRVKGLGKLLKFLGSVVESENMIALFR